MNLVKRAIMRVMIGQGGIGDWFIGNIEYDLRANVGDLSWGVIENKLDVGEAYIGACTGWMREV